MHTSISQEFVIISDELILFDFFFSFFACSHLILISIFYSLINSIFYSINESFFSHFFSLFPSSYYYLVTMLERQYRNSRRWKHSTYNILYYSLFSFARSRIFDAESSTSKQKKEEEEEERKNLPDVYVFVALGRKKREKEWEKHA